MNWSQFKDPVSHMCLAGTVEASCSLTQEVAGSTPLMTNIFVTALAEFSENIFRKNSIDFVLKGVEVSFYSGICKSLNHRLRLI